ncbi:MAG: transport system permease protein [Cereibacter sp.]|nr:transport system permease protein [Cereibacter sp.]
MTGGLLSRHAPAGDRSGRATTTLGLLLLIVAAMSVLSIGSGASGVSLPHVLQDLLRGQEIEARDRLILWGIRLPRLAMGLLVGAALAVSGVLMQGLFRNPLADPGIVGVGSGAGLGAALAIVLGPWLPAFLPTLWLVPLAAFAGGWAMTVLLYRTATRAGQTSVATMLLGGLAFGALAEAARGLLTYLADDQQLRDLTFWSMGSLAGASWRKVGAALPLILPVLLLAPLMARGLNALALGEAAARHLGIPVQRVKRLAVLGVASATGASVAMAGGIGFIGIVVPHLLRLATGPDHRFLLPNAALLGAALLVGADVVARLIVAPAEMPIGILTAVIGAPVFLWILLRQGYGLDLR